MDIFVILSILVFLIGSLFLTIYTVLNAVQKRRVEKQDVKSYLEKISALFWGMG